VDVHNYLQVSLPDGGMMKVDATWPLSARKAGMVINEAFVPGQDHELAATPLECWPVPEGREPQAFKDELLQAHFTPQELEFREMIIRALSEKTSAV
jgi:hypothetical protein